MVAMLGIDLGTSSVKALVLDSTGKVLGEGRADYAVLSPQAGHAESEPSAWWQATVTATRTAIVQAGSSDIAGIGLSGQMHGVVLLDEHGQPLRNALLWADNRATNELELYRALPAASRHGLANPLVPGMAGPLLLWVAHHEEALYQRARWALQPKDWLRYQLTGQIATDASDASATLLYDVLHNRWADDVISALGLRRELFPAILASDASAGGLTEQAASALSLSAGIPVAVGAADTAAAALGTGLFTLNDVQLTLGTGAQLLQLSASPQVESEPRTHLYRAADGRNWYTMAAVQNAGLVLDWVCRTLNATWDDLYGSAQRVAPGSDGLIFLPYLTGERPHQPIVHTEGAFVHLTLYHTRAHMFHAALEGVAFGIRMAFDALPGAQRTSVIRLAGGGSVHPAWRQMLADILNRELLIIDAPSASARGAALLGGIAGGVWNDIYATAALAPGAQLSIKPDTQRSATYEEAYARFVRLSKGEDTF